jgi:hypothetical protein
MGLLTKPNELTVKETYAGLIYGQPGVGKSTLALSSVNPVCIDVDRGMYRVEKRYQVPSLQVENYQAVLDLLSSNELDGFDTIVIDTLGKLVDCMVDYVGKNTPKYRQSNGQLTQQGWGQLKVEFRALVKLIIGKNKSVIFVAHESEEKEGEKTKKRPDVSGSARKDIVKELDFMGYMEMSGDKRTISFSPTDTHYAKNSMGLDAVIGIPEIGIGNTFIKDVVVSAIKNRKEQDNVHAGHYDELIKNINDIISSVKDTASLNEAYGKITALPHIWDSKLYAWSKITEAAKPHGAAWDKAVKQFTGPETPKQDVNPGGHSPGPPVNENAAPPPASPVERACQEAVTELYNIMKSVTEAGGRYFTEDEYKSVHEKLLSFPKTPGEFRLNLIRKLLETQKNILREKVKTFDECHAGASASKPEARDEINKFEEDLF